MFVEQKYLETQGEDRPLGVDGEENVGSGTGEIGLRRTNTYVPMIEEADEEEEETKQSYIDENNMTFGLKIEET